VLLSRIISDVITHIISGVITHHQWHYHSGHQKRYETSIVALWHIPSVVISRHQWHHDTSSVTLWHHQWCYDIISGVMAHHQWHYSKPWPSPFCLNFQWKKAILPLLYKLNKCPISTAQLSFHLFSVTNIKPFGGSSWSSVQRFLFIILHGLGVSSVQTSLRTVTFYLTTWDISARTLHTVPLLLSVSHYRRRKDALFLQLQMRLHQRMCRKK
jgi:hypothetical protein